MQRSRGFTLIELLVVIAVIALLLSILMPALTKAKDLAMGAACKGNLKNFTFGMAMYLDDNDGNFCSAHTCYFRSTDRLPVESGIGGNHLHLRWFDRSGREPGLLHLPPVQPRSHGICQRGPRHLLLFPAKDPQGSGGSRSTGAGWPLRYCTAAIALPATVQGSAFENSCGRERCVR